MIISWKELTACATETQRTVTSASLFFLTSDFDNAIEVLLSKNVIDVIQNKKFHLFYLQFTSIENPMSNAEI